MQAIITKYLSATNVRGTRIKAIAAAGSVTLSWDDALNSDDNHTAAARALATKYGWHGTWIGGTTVNGHNVYVCTDAYYVAGTFTIARDQAA